MKERGVVVKKKRGMILKSCEDRVKWGVDGIRRQIEIYAFRIDRV